MKRIIKEGDKFIPQYKQLFMRHNYYFDDCMYCWRESFNTIEEAKDFLYPKKEESEVVFNEQEIYNIDIWTPLIWIWIIAIIIYIVTTLIKC